MRGVASDSDERFLAHYLQLRPLNLPLMRWNCSVQVQIITMLSSDPVLKPLPIVPSRHMQITPFPWGAHSGSIFSFDCLNSRLHCWRPHFSMMLSLNSILSCRRCMTFHHPIKKQSSVGPQRLLPRFPGVLFLPKSVHPSCSIFRLQDH